MFQSKNFTFNNITNTDMGVMMIYSSLPTKILGVQKSTSSSSRTPKNYLGTSFHDNLNIPTFSIYLTFVDSSEIAIMPTVQQKIKVLNWLMPSDGQYKAFVPEDNGLEYYVKVTSMTEQQYQNGVELQLTFQMNSPYTYIPLIVKDFNLSGMPNQTATINVENLCNVMTTFKPIIRFKASPYSTGTTSFTVTNNTTGDSFTISDIEAGESIYINNRREFINSSLEDTFRLNNFTGDFIKMYQGMNNLTFKGEGKVFFEAHYPTLMF